MSIKSSNLIKSPPFPDEDFKSLSVQMDRRQRKFLKSLGAKENDACIIAGTHVVFMDADSAFARFLGGIDWKTNQ